VSNSKGFDNPNFLNLQGEDKANFITKLNPSLTLTSKVKTQLINKVTPAPSDPP